MSRVVVLGNATVDVLLAVERLPVPGETLLARSLLRCAGGKGLNQAIAAARAGAATVFVATAGNDADGIFLRSSLINEARLTLRWRQIDQPTDVSTIWVASSGENMIVSSATCAHSLGEAEVSDLLADLAADDLLVVQGNLTAETTLFAMNHARKCRARVILNTAPIAWSMGEALALAEVVVANEPEAMALTGETGEAAVRMLQQRTGAAAVLSLGSKGALLADADGVSPVAAPIVVAVDTAGAGDVMVGTLVAELAGHRPLRQAVALAVAAASLSVTKRGTSPSFPTPSEIDALRAGIAL